jgi:hypothetical protein
MVPYAQPYHLIAVPAHEDSLARAIGEAHRRYTRMINSRENWRGHLWQERFASFPMSERYLLVENDKFIKQIETDLTRIVHPLKRGPKPKPHC